MAEYSMRIQIADILIRFESDLASDISDIGNFFKYHHTDSLQEVDCTVQLKRQSCFHMPKDAELQWQSKSQTIAEHKGRVGRRRIKTSSVIDTFGMASCYVSRERGEYYYGLMQDKTWICCCPSKHRIRYVLHQRPQRKSKYRLSEEIDSTSAIPLLIHVISTLFGRVLIHGAAVCVDGRASLFLGESGSGKSTLSTDLAKQKSEFMGDDLVLVYLKDGVPMVGALLFQAKLRPTDSDEKISVDVPKEMQAKYCLSAPLNAVYLVQQCRVQESTVNPLPSVDLLQQLLVASNGMMMQYDKQQWLFSMYEISDRVPYFLLNFGEPSLLKISLLKN